MFWANLWCAALRGGNFGVRFLDPSFFDMSAGGEKTRLGSPRFQWQRLTSFEEAAAHTPSARPPRSRLISGAQRSCVCGCSRSVRCTRRRPCHMTPLRGKRPSAWLARAWHACTWHQTLLPATGSASHAPRWCRKCSASSLAVSSRCHAHGLSLIHI